MKRRNFRLIIIRVGGSRAVEERGKVAARAAASDCSAGTALHCTRGSFVIRVTVFKYSQLYSTRQDKDAFVHFSLMCFYIKAILNVLLH